VVDFVDMKNTANRKEIERTLLEALQQDRAKTYVLPMSKIGLIEMTRKRTRHSLVQSLTETCFYCEGKGYLRSSQVIVSGILGSIASRLAAGRKGTLTVAAHPVVVTALNEEHGVLLEKMQTEHRVTIELKSEDARHFESYDIS
jgi:ribonuclease G